MNRLRIVASAAVLALAVGALAGCGGGKPEGCVEVDDELLANIAEGTTEDGVPITPVAGAAYPSPSTDGLYYVAMEFTAPGVEDGDEGVWLASSLEPNTGGFVAVDGMAQEFTQWPDTVNGTKFNITADGAQEALDCLG